MECPEAFQQSGNPQMCEIVVEHDAMLKLRISGHNVRDSRSSPGLRQHATPGPSIRGDPPGRTRSNVFCFQQQHSAFQHRGEALRFCLFAPHWLNAGSVETYDLNTEGCCPGQCGRVATLRGGPLRQAQSLSVLAAEQTGCCKLAC